MFCKIRCPLTTDTVAFVPNQEEVEQLLLGDLQDNFQL